MRPKIVDRTVKCAVLFILSATLFYPAKIEAQNTLGLCPDNHHYLMYQNKPVILLTSGEHYGSLLNLDFDYIKYLNALQKEGMNDTRIFSGTYVEREKDIDWMGYGNTLAPKPGRLICPWKRSNVPGYLNGGNKFDLNHWNEAYFVRLKDLLHQAAKRNIMVEFTLFGNQYGDGIYSASPLYPDNNIQKIGIKQKDGFLQFQTLKIAALVARQDAMVVKIVTELNSFDNLYYEISNEPYNGVKDSLSVNEWHLHIINLIRKTEKDLPKKHLIASNQAVVENPEVSIADYHYVHIPNAPDFKFLLRLNKVIGMNETMGSLKDEDANDVRVEAWDFILHGGGAYNNLSWEYRPETPAGTRGSDTVRQYLAHLQKFMDGFDYTKMKYASNLVVKKPEKAITRLLAAAGSQYALYIHHSAPDIAEPKEEGVWKYNSDTSVFTDTVSVQLPAGNYVAKWYYPATGEWFSNPVEWKQDNGNHVFYTPSFTTDIALKITTESTRLR